MDELIQARVAHPLIVIRFRIDPDLAMVFHCVENEHGRLASVGLVPVRLSKGVDFMRLNPDLMHKVFCPRVRATADNEWTLAIRPLADDIRVQKRKSGKYACFYPFPAQKRSGQLVDVWVDGTPPPDMKMWFTVNATYQATRDSGKQTLQSTVQCPSDFTDQLAGLAGQ